MRAALGVFLVFCCICVSSAASNAFSFNAKFIAVGMDNQLYTKRRLTSSFSWMVIPASCCVTQIHSLKDGRILGINRHHGIVQMKLPVIGRRRKRWCKALQKSKNRWQRLNNTCCVKSISLSNRKIFMRAKIISVGKNSQLYFKPSLNSPWGRIKNSGRVRAIAITRDGLLIGIGANDHLYSRKSIDDAKWKLLPASCCVKSITQLPGGRFVGVDVGNRLVQKPSLLGRWMQVRNSCCVTSITSLNDGSIVGVGKDGALHQRKSLESPWIGPIGNSFDVKLIDVKYSARENILYGVTDKHKVVKKECNFIDSAWDEAGSYNCCSISIAVE